MWVILIGVKRYWVWGSCCLTVTCLTTCSSGSTHWLLFAFHNVCFMFWLPTLSSGLSRCLWSLTYALFALSCKSLWIKASTKWLHVCVWSLPPIVLSWNSWNCPLTKRRTRLDFPTADSPSNTSLNWQILFPALGPLGLVAPPRLAMT